MTKPQNIRFLLSTGRRLRLGLFVCLAAAEEKKERKGGRKVALERKKERKKERKAEGYISLTAIPFFRISSYLSISISPHHHGTIYVCYFTHWVSGLAGLGGLGGIRTSNQAGVQDRFRFRFRHIHTYMELFI